MAASPESKCAKRGSGFGGPRKDIYRDLRCALILLIYFRVFRRRVTTPRTGVRS